MYYPGSAGILYTCGVHVALASNLPSITSTSVLAYTFVCAYYTYTTYSVTSAAGELLLLSFMYYHYQPYFLCFQWTVLNCCTNLTKRER